MAQIKTNTPLAYLNDLSLDKKSLVIFDIDSTIYDVSPRTQKIVSDFCDQDEFKKIDTEACEHLKNIVIKSTDWGFAEALERENFKSYFKLISALTRFWSKNFFSNNYLKFDEIYPGAKEFINLISQKASIKYLTGRSEKLMLEGTLEQLIKDKLPLINEDDLITKKNLEPDHIYKLNEVKKLKDKYSNIVIFENEPLIINSIHSEFNNMPFVFINSTHSRKAKLETDFPKIDMDYRPFIST